MRETNSKLVYSTDGGRIAPAKGPRPGPSSPSSIQAPDDGVVRVHRAKAARGGKTMTAVSGLPGTETNLDALLKSLKAALGTGGVREGRVLMVQGDHRERVLAELTKWGHRPKLAGG